jgi:hypothetical protein
VYQDHHTKLYRMYSKSRGGTRYNQGAGGHQVQPGEYCVVPLQWLETWYEYVSDPTVDRVPGPLDLSEFLCDHSLANIDPNITTDAKDTSHTRYYPVPLESFAEFRSRYGGQGEIHYVLTSAKLNATIKLEPATCAECRTARIEREHVALLSYDSTVLSVQVRRSGGTRTRRATSKRTIEVDVNATDTTSELRLKIYAAIDVPPYLQRIFKGDIPLDDDSEHTLPYVLLLLSGLRGAVGQLPSCC